MKFRLAWPRFLSVAIASCATSDQSDCGFQGTSRSAQGPKCEARLAADSGQRTISRVESAPVALSATVYRIQIELSDVDRGVYEVLDLRLGRHPSETMRYLLTRVLAYCLCYEEGIAFTKGLSTNDEPAIWVRDLQGDLRVWIEVGTPSAERLHKASKASPRLVVFTYADPELLQEAARAKAIYKADRLEIYALDPAFLDALDAITDRNARWTLVHTEGMLYVTSGAESLSTPVIRHTLTG